MKKITLAQISDCHLFANVNDLHHHGNVYQNLLDILSQIKNNTEVDLIIFTGDLTQDHSEQSYKNFVSIVDELTLEIPVYFLAGNHDEPQLLSQYLNGKPFQQDTVIETEYWQFLLLDTKSETPSGFFNIEKFKQQKNKTNLNKNQFLFMHHHPINVGYFIDQHPLINQDEFWREVSELPYCKGIACGHVHLEKQMERLDEGKVIPLFTCPATSIQFDESASTVKASSKPGGYRLFTFLPNGNFQSTCYYLETLNDH